MRTNLLPVYKCDLCGAEVQQYRDDIPEDWAHCTVTYGKLAECFHICFSCRPDRKAAYDFKNIFNKLMNKTEGEK